MCYHLPCTLQLCLLRNCASVPASHLHNVSSPQGQLVLLGVVLSQQEVQCIVNQIPYPKKAQVKQSCFDSKRSKLFLNFMLWWLCCSYSLFSKQGVSARSTWAVTDEQTGPAKGVMEVISLWHKLEIDNLSMFHAKGPFDILFSRCLDWRMYFTELVADLLKHFHGV